MQLAPKLGGWILTIFKQILPNWAFQMCPGSTRRQILFTCVSKQWYLSILYPVLSKKKREKSVLYLFSSTTFQEECAKTNNSRNLNLLCSERLPVGQIPLKWNTAQNQSFKDVSPCSDGWHYPALWPLFSNTPEYNDTKSTDPLFFSKPSNRGWSV